MSKLVNFKWERALSESILAPVAVLLEGTERLSTAEETTGAARLIRAAFPPARGWAMASVAILSLVASACGTSTKPSAGIRPRAGATTTTSPLSATESAVLSAWKAAENAFYTAEADPRGLFSSALGQTMVNPELLLVKRNLAGNEHAGFIGRGTWNLGNPQVLQLGPTADHPTNATVVSCIHGMQRLVNIQTGQPAPGVAGQVDWVGSTSTMVLTSSSWKLSQQSAVVNGARSVACAGIG